MCVQPSFPGICSYLSVCLPPDFLPTLRTLLGHQVYLIYLCVTIIQLNSLIGMVTYKPKYIEQHFRQSASKANFLMGTFTDAEMLFLCQIVPPA